MEGRNRHPPPRHHALIEDAHRQLSNQHRGGASILGSPPSPPPPPHRLHHHHLHHHPHHHHQTMMEEHFEAQNREMQTLLLDNQRLAAMHVALKQDLSAAQQELRHISATCAKVKESRDAQVRDVYERTLELEVEVRKVDALNAELVQVRKDVQKLNASRLELTSQLQAMNDDLKLIRDDSQQGSSIKAEIESMHHELQRGRAAIEYEKKTQSENLEHRQTMERNRITMAREIEKLHAELEDAEKRARAAAAAAAAANPAGPAYAASYGHPDMVYGGHPYPDPYGIHQVHGGTDAGIHYGPGPVAHGPYDMQINHVHR